MLTSSPSTGLSLRPQQKRGTPRIKVLRRPPPDIAYVLAGEDFDAFCSKAGDRPKFGAPWLPAIGSTLLSNRTYFRHDRKPNEVAAEPLERLSVIGYYVEWSWLYVVCLPMRPGANRGDRVLVGGNDLLR